MGEHDEVAIGRTQRLHVLEDFMGFRAEFADGKVIATLSPCLFGAGAAHHVDGFKPLCVVSAISVGIDDALVLLPFLVRVDEADLEGVGQVDELFASGIAVGIARRDVQDRNALGNVPNNGVFAIPQAVARPRMGRDITQGVDNRSAFDHAVKDPAR